MRRKAAVFFAVQAAAVGLAAACSPTTRYRVLSFFVDGVPPPARPSPTPPSNATALDDGAGEPTRQPPPRVLRYYAHAPYRDNRCAGCHDIDNGRMVKSVEGGLCLTCHSALVKDLRYLHGPVALNACTQCHHPHTAPFPKLLLKGPTETCLNCHDRDDLTTDEHHAELERQTCVECHHAHGGADRFFLKPGRP